MIMLRLAVYLCIPLKGPRRYVLPISITTYGSSYTNLLALWKNRTSIYSALYRTVLNICYSLYIFKYIRYINASKKVACSIILQAIFYITEKKRAQGKYKRRTGKKLYREKEQIKEPVYDYYTRTYYRSRTKTKTAGTTTYKWSTYEDTTLLNDNYHYTGNIKIEINYFISMIIFCFAIAITTQM